MNKYTLRTFTSACNPAEAFVHAMRALQPPDPTRRFYAASKIDGRSNHPW